MVEFILQVTWVLLWLGVIALVLYRQEKRDQSHAEPQVDPWDTFFLLQELSDEHKEHGLCRGAQLQVQLTFSQAIPQEIAESIAYKLRTFVITTVVADNKTVQVDDPRLLGSGVTMDMKTLTTLTLEPLSEYKERVAKTRPKPAGG